MKKALCLVLAIVMTLSLVACGATEKAPTAPPADAPAQSNDAPAAVDPIVIRAGLLDTTAELETVPSSMALLRMFEAVEERTNGAVKFEVFSNGELASSGEQCITGAQNGALDLFSLASSSWGAYTNAFTCMGLPFLVANSAEAYAFLDSDFVRTTLYDKLQADLGLKVLGSFDIGFRQFTSNKETKGVADLAGQKVRVMNDPTQVAAWTALGASTQVINYSELFTALQQGVVDAQENPLANIMSANLYEVQDYMTLTNHVYTATMIVISEDAWAKIPAEYQTIIEEEMTVATQWCRETGEANQDGILAELSKTMEIYEPTAEEMAEFAELARTSWTTAEEAIGADVMKQLYETLDEISGK